MRCLVTGATGHLGTHLVRLLKREGCDVLAMGRSSELRQIGEFAPEVVFHLAWSGIDRDARANASQLHENIPYALRVFRAAAAAGARTWIGVGSQAEYGEPGGLLLTETMEPRPVSPYGFAKHTVASLTRTLCALASVRYVWMRLFAVYGPDDDERHLIPMVIEALHNGTTPALSDGSQLVDMLYVEDAAEALFTAAKENIEGIFNLASGEPRSVRDIVELVRDVVAPGEALGFGAIDERPKDLRADISRLLAATSWRPRTALRDGIGRTIGALA